MSSKKIQLIGSLGAEVDSTLSQSGLAADAKVTGDAISELNTLVGDTAVSEQIDNHNISSETHSDIRTEISEISALVGDEKVSDQISTAIASKSNVGHTHTASEIGADVSGAAAGALTSAKSYTDEKIADLINSAPTTLDTLGEIATAMQENDTVVDALEDAIGTKANASDLTSHTGNKSNPHGVTLAQLGVNATATELNYVDGVTSAIQTQLNAKVPTSRTVNGKALSSNITLSASDVGADSSGSANTALTNAKAYTDAEITEWVGDKTVAAQISSAIENKVDKVSGKGLSTNDYTTTEKDKLAGIASGAEVNQNAFSTIKVGSTEVKADSKTDTLTLVAGSNITITPDTTNDKVTIAATDTVYTHPSYTAKSAGLYKVTVDSTGHVSAATAVAKSDITGLGIPAQDTTYSAATTSAAGLMSAADKTKLDGIATGANKITVDSALSSTSTNPVQNKVVNTAISNLNTLVGDAKVSEQISNAIGNVVKVDPNDTAISGTANPINADTLSGMTYDQLKADLSGNGTAGEHTHSEYVNQNAFGNVVVGSTTIAADHVTDTLTFVAGSNITLTPDATNDKITIAAKDTVYTHPTTSGNKHIPSGGSSGQILRWSADGTAVWGADNNTTYNVVTTSANGLMSAADKTALDNLVTRVGDTKVSDQIASAVSGITYSTVGAAAASHTHNYIPLAATCLTSEDLNNYTSSNVEYFYAGGGNTCINNPGGSGQAFGLYKYRSANGYVTQELTSQSFDKYMRGWNSGNWTNWEKLITSADFSLSGTVLTITTT